MDRRSQNWESSYTPKKITFNFFHEMEVYSVDVATVGIFAIFMV